MHIRILRAAAFVVVFFTSFRLFAAAPTATTSAATSITTSSAVLNGAGVPNGQATTGWFRISSSSPGTCDDTFGTRVPAASGTDLGAGAASVPYSITATGLSPGVTYYFCAIVSNVSGTAFGSVLSFTVPAQPAVLTGGATSVTSSGATLQGSATPNASLTTGWFRYSTTNPGTCNDTFGTRAPGSGGSNLGSGGSAVDYMFAISSLTPGATYYYCAIASNAYGTSFGNVLSFTALANAPVVATTGATLVTGSTAQLNGSANPGGAATTGWFRYATVNPVTCNDVFGSRAPVSGGSSLGAGNSSVAYALGVTGLLPSTTYYYCAIAQNSVGTAFGTVQVFTTPSPPTVTTTTASNLTNTSAYVYGSAIPNGSPTTGYFRYGLSDPGTCDDTFGSRAPLSGGTSLGSGGSTQNFNQQLTGLSAGTTYYYCAIAMNAEGTSFGAVLSFVTPTAPLATTSAATLLTSSSATLNGAVDPNGDYGYGYFRYSTASPGTCNDSFGTRIPSSSFSDAGLGTGTSPVAYSFPISGLTPGTTYYFCAIGRNAYGTVFGSVLSFTTLTAPPQVSTSGATLLTGTTATLNGSANPGAAATTGWFRYGAASPGTCNDSFGTRAPAAGGSSLGTGTSFAAFSQGITGLLPGTTYYFCAIAQNAMGTAFGLIQTFTTPLPPAVTTNNASNLTNTTAYLYGSAIPNGAPTTGYFRYSSTDPGACDDAFGSRAPASGGSSLGSGTSSQNFNQQITGLSAGSTYYFCAIAMSAEGTSFGAVLSFVTPTSPMTTTTAATLVTSSTATLNGSVDPNGDYGYGYHRYATVSPGTCNDSFGTRVPSSSFSDTGLGSGTSPVAYSYPIGGLLPGTTYYFCAIGRNAYGTAFGSVLSFTTLTAAPQVSTNSASMLTSATAQLNASANPGGASTTGWFRYAAASPGSCNDSFGTRAPAAGGAALGAGTSFTAFSQGISGLLPSTTYYFCAIAQNAVGTVFGSLLTFTTPTPPSVTTNNAANITNTSAYLYGSANPNGSSTTGFFRYSLTDPGTCDDAFGSRAPVSGGSGLGAGNSNQNYNQQLTGLSAGTTYYFCALATSAEGTSFGAVLSFTTSTAPQTTTTAATLVTASSATLNGSVDPNGDYGYGYHRYSTVSPGTCNDSFGTRIPSSSFSDTGLGAGTSPVAYSYPISGLLPGTTYYFCAIGRNNYGTVFGSVLSFTTLAAAPQVGTSSATLLTGTTAQLNGTANPGGASTTGWFRYGAASPGSCNDSFGTRAPVAGGSSLGAGTSFTAFSQGITGLLPGTTYYFCAIGMNSVGTAFGTVQSFTTPLPPVVTTNNAANLTNTTAYLYGSAIPNGAPTTGYFRYSATDPGVCDDSFGSRAPLSGGSSLGSGTSSQNFNQQLTGLSAGATYYFCAIAMSVEGTSFGAVLSFTTPTAPQTTTTAATLVTSSTATLNGSVDPNGDYAYGYHRYSTVSPGTCNDSFGTRIPSSSFSDTGLGSGTSPVAYSYPIGGLLPGTTYYVCAIGRNAYGTVFGSVLSFTTLTAAPTVSTGSASLLTGTTAQLNGSSNPGGAATTGWFRYATASPGSCNDSFGTRAPVSGGSALGSGTSNTAFLQSITGLVPATTYYFCAIAQNAVGTVFGAVQSFTTPSPPTVTTNNAANLTNTSAYLYGAAIPNGSATTGYFRYGLSDPGTCDDSFGSRAPVSGGSSLGSGTSSQNFNQQLTALSAGTTYYFCAIATSAEGTAFGAVLSFTTPTLPTVTTSAATLLTSTSATLNGAADPNGDYAYGYYRYSTSNPVICNDSFGTRIPSSSFSDTGLGSGTTPVAHSYPISGLTPGTTYYFCALGRNAYGTAFGSVLSFTTPATQPTVTTSSASGVTTTTATLNAFGNPGGADTTGWFRYATASPGTCNDSFGTRAPASGGSPLGAGTSSIAYGRGITGLSPGTTYYFCAIVMNSVGTAFGAVNSFSTTAPPTVNTLAATPVTATTATLNASVNPNGFATTGWFRYSTINPGACDTIFGTSTATSALGSGSTTVGLLQPLASLSPATTYYFCALAQSSIGTSLGAVLSFTTPAAPPTVVSVAASDITATSATLNGTVNPNGSDSVGWFRYSSINPGSCNDSFGTRAPLADGMAFPSGNSAVSFSEPLSGLTGGTTYYFCAIASSNIGTSVGSLLSFTTASAPSVTTSAATLVTSTGATLNGAGTPNVSATTGWFRYDTANPGTCNDSFGTRAPVSGGTALGSGTSAVSYSQVLSGLVSGTTYYFCAIAQNAVGTSFGTVLSFATAATPSVTTVAVTGVTGTAATLNGSANPNLLTATGWFRYSTVDPGTCTDSFGTRAPASGGTALGAGASAVAYSQSLAGLVAGTTYYYCAIASNSSGTGFGAVMSFTTAASPTVVSSAATVVTGTTATLNGSANPNQLTATGWFRYATASPGTCNDSFGTRAPASGGSALGAGTSPVAYSQAISGLVAGTTYYFCAIASNSLGTKFGAVLSFTTLAAPTVTSVAATTVTTTDATLNGTANPNLIDATGWFRYSTVSPGTCNDSFGTRAPASGGTALGAGGVAVPYSEVLTGLVSGTTYYFCAIADNLAGTRFGAVLSFTTPAAPTVTTVAASSVTSTAATLNGSANPKASATTGWFRYDTANPGTCDDSFGTRAPVSGGSSLGSGSSAVAYSQVLSGLVSGTTYYFCAIAQNSVGMSFGTVLSFTTASAPAVTTVAVTGVTGTAATLNGSANPNLLTATGWFRYSTVNPVTCTDSFGTRAPVSGGTALGAGGSAVAYSQAISGLVAGTTYYYCALASNSQGTGFGTVMSFTTAASPTVMTVAASSVTSTGATLNGSASPNLLTATGWFRYSTVNPATCNDSFGTRAPVSGGTALGAGGAAVAYSQSVSGLVAGTTYYFCAIASNSLGTKFGAVMSFMTLAGPTVTTSAATAVTSTDAMLNGSANPNLLDANGWFRYSTVSPGTCNDSFGTRAPVSGGTALGAGGVAVPYSEVLTGLAAGTTYYFCAIADNAVGTRFGAVLSFTTTATPTVTTLAASSVSSTGATLNGSANPKLDAATGWFRISTTDPGICDDSFGARAPASGGSSLGSGSSAVAYSQVLSGLASGTTYYYCAIAANSVGTSFGAVLSFTTTAAPFVITSAATGVTDTAATLNGSANPNLLTATGWFRYSTINPGTCNDTFGTRAPTVGGTALGAGSSLVPYSRALTGLVPGSTYYFCAIASNSVGTNFGAVMSFTMLAPPSVISVAATSVTSTGATLNGSANPNLGDATGWFRYSTIAPASCNDSFGTRSPAAGGTALGAGASSVDYAQSLGSLSPATTYYFCAIASNSLGKSFGAVLSFMTPGAPSVTTQAATAVSSTGATLNASANPNLSDATGWFRYSTSDPGSCNDSFGTRAPASGGSSLGAGSTSVIYTEPLTGLVPGSTYYYCAVASNSLGVGVGAVLSFKTPAAPSVTTGSAISVFSTSAIINGSANPNLSASTGWFRYGTMNPGTCNDSFGTRAPLSGGTSLGAGSSLVAYSNALMGLSPLTTYYYCAVASNSVGVSFGAVLSFSTSGAPMVTTKAATDLTSGEATLNGSANPGLAATTGWFRYHTADPGACDDTFGTRVPATGGTALGAGSSPVDYLEAITGLLPGTKYYFCAIASNQDGTKFGQVLSLVTAVDPPTVITSPPTNVEADSASLNGSANPNGDATTGWFRYDTTDPGACDDSFGVRAPASGGLALGSGVKPGAYSNPISGLTPGTTYYYCAIAANSKGTGFGEVVTFLPTAVAPTVITEEAIEIVGAGATLAGTANPNSGPTTGYFRYGVTDPGTCDDSFGTRAPATGGVDLGKETDPVAFSQAVTGLEPNRVYYYCAAASNWGGATFGEVLSFTSDEVPPTVETLPPLSNGNYSITLNGAANPNASETIGWFRFDNVDPGECNDTFGTRLPAVDGTALGADRKEVAFTETETGVGAGTYYVCAIASNAAGIAFGKVVMFDVPKEVIPDAPRGEDGCGCRVGSSGNNGSMASLAALLLLAFRRRRRQA